MAIQYACGCGKPFEVPDGWAGRRARCPDCKAVTVIPAAPEVVDAVMVEDDPPGAYGVVDDRRRQVTFEVVDDPPPALDPRERFRFKSVAEAARAGNRRGGRETTFTRDDDESDDARGTPLDPRRQPRERETEKRQGRGLESRVFNGGVLGGSLAMIIAVIWFVAGLANDVIFFYPPVLFILGLVGLIKGLARGE